MKLLSLNVSFLESNNSKLTKFLQDQKADILCLQEVVREVESSVLPKYVTKSPIDSATYYLRYGFFGPNFIMDMFDQKDFHGQDNFHFDLCGKAEIGNYTKSKFKIEKTQNIFVENHFAYTDFANWPEEDYKAFTVTDLSVEEKALRILNYHGIWTRDKLGNDKTLKACKKINELAKDFLGEVIICGDFNLFPNTPSMKVFEKDFISLVDKYNIKSTRPSSNELSEQKRNVVDYIWVSKGIKVKDFKVIDSDVSDHLPLVMTFEM